MPSRAPSKKEGSTSSGEIDHGSEWTRNTTRRSPRASQSLKFKDKVVKPDNCVCPPYSDLPLEFVKNKEEELVKYMSKVPDYLQRGEKLQDNVLNFGVLDWGRLEQWTHKREKVVSDKITKPASGSCSSSKYKEKYLGQDSSDSDHKGLLKSSKELNSSKAFLDEGLELDTGDQDCSGKQEGIVVLLPKDFSSSGSSKVHRRASLDVNSEYNWGSFSDLFSIDEIHPQESVSEIPHSCPLNSELEIEKELDLKLDTLIKSQGIEVPVNPLDKASKDRNVQKYSDEINGDGSLHGRLSSGLARITRSLSFRESSSQPPLSSTYETAKSGPAKHEHCSSINGRAKVSPLRRFLDPIFRSKVLDQVVERSDDLIVKKPAPIPMNVEQEPPTIKALLHLTVKSGLPLFKFVVGKNDEIFASTVKSLRTLRKDDTSWLYTFYSVQKIRKRGSSSWKNHQKVKPSGLGYSVVGQMKVSEPRIPSWCEQKLKERQMVKESVLYNVEVSKADGLISDFKTSRELAAIVVNMPDNLNDWFSESEHEKLGHIVVILPGGDHSVPHDGVPSSLITRWRNGGSCDCGGWDVGCKLRILTEKWQQRKYLQVQCDLYDQEVKQNTPFFSLIPLRDGLFSVEYGAQISSLQAFFISAALINSHNPAYSATDEFASKQQLGSTMASMAIKSEGPEKHASHPHPPLSPVGRV